jgi:hypothetical protein
MKSLKSIINLCVIGLLLLNGQSLAQVKDTPAPIAAALLVKVISFEKNISSSDITIYVLGSSEITAELKKAIGQANIKNVLSGNSLPATKPSILFIGDANKIAVAIEYTRKNKILSATNIPDLVAKGVTLGFGLGDDNKPKILLNLNSSVEEGLDWNPAIMKVAQIIK